MISSSDPILAIDFGTSNSLVGCVVNGKPCPAISIDPFASDPTLMRTLLYFPEPNHCFYGAEALSQYTELGMEGRLFRSFKSHLPNPHYTGSVVGNRRLSIEVMVGTFLLELKKRAEKSMNKTFQHVVLGRPARYSMDAELDQLAQDRMLKAAQFAGFTNIHFIAEPLAAAFNYRKNNNSEKILLVGDFGGGTSDFTVLRLTKNEFQSSDVLAVEGCPQAGDAFDSLFMSQRLNKQFGAESVYRMPMSSNVLNMPSSILQKLNHPAHIVHLKEKETYEFIKEVRKCAISDSDKESIDRLFLLMDDQQIFSYFENIEMTKRNLSSADSTSFKFNYPGLEIDSEFFKSEFVKWSKKLKEKIFESLDLCMQMANLKPVDVDLVCLTGGTAQNSFDQK